MQEDEIIEPTVRAHAQGGTAMTARHRRFIDAVIVPYLSPEAACQAFGK